MPTRGDASGRKIRELPFRSNARDKRGLEFEIFQVADLYEREARGELQTPLAMPARLGFHVMYIGLEGAGQHVIDFHALSVGSRLSHGVLVLICLFARRCHSFREGDMAVNAVRCSTLDDFRSEWVRGSLDYQRAVEALDAARQWVEEARAVGGAAVDDENALHAHETAENARQRLAEIEAALERQFNEFCGVSE